jgi:hypothetical protein
MSKGANVKAKKRTVTIKAWAVVSRDGEVERIEVSRTLAKICQMEALGEVIVPCTVTISHSTGESK